MSDIYYVLYRINMLNVNENKCTLRALKALNARVMVDNIFK